MAAVAPQTPIDSSTPVDLTTIPISPEGANRDENKKPTPSGEDEQITVFHDKDNFNVKHPLMHKWTLWFTKPPSGKASFAPGPPKHTSADFMRRAITGMIC
jgi:translation initiation factor 4E